MSGQTQQYYQLFGPIDPPSQPLGQPEKPCKEPPGPRNSPPNSSPNYNIVYPPNYNQPPQNFAEYSLWGSSSYNPSELVQPGGSCSGVFQQHHRSPPYPPPPHFCPEYLLDFPPAPAAPPVPAVPPDAKTQTEDEAVGGSEEPELSGLEEVEKIVIEKEALYRNPHDEDDYYDSDENLDTVEQASNSSGSSAGDWTQANFQRAGAYPPSYPWASRPARVVNNRGKKANIMQQRLVQALSQPVLIDKGASMMQRMGWMGGGLGRDGSGILDPVAPNAVYASSTLGFGQETEKTPPKKNRARSIPENFKNKKNKAFFQTNLLKALLEFVKNDMILELYFDNRLMSSERKRIHQLVSALGEDQEEVLKLTTTRQQELVNEIDRRNRYILATQSDGEGLQRQICVFKLAPHTMFLVTPDDCRPCLTEIKEVEEESNPFMKSIKKHIKKDEGTILKEKPPMLLDKLVVFFLDFCADEGYMEFRFVGPFSEKEVAVISSFFALIEDLAQKQRPHFKCPVELLDVFATDFRFRTVAEPNGFKAILKLPFSLRKEYKKQQEQKQTESKKPKNYCNLIQLNI